MYENMTFKSVLNRALSNVPSNVDKREGSVIYDALAPMAMELAMVYAQLDTIMQETFADTCNRENLIKRCAERGITPEEATSSVIKGEFNIEIALNTRFSIDSVNFISKELIEQKNGYFYYKMVCETVGVEGNKHLGTMIPINYINGLTHCELVEIITAGEDEEDTEVLRKRYLDSISSIAYGGNKSDYKQKIKAIEGVGGVKIYSGYEWNGGGTVLCVLQAANYGKISEELAEEIQIAVDPQEHTGEGVGIAPIGHYVTVVGANEKNIDITLTLELQSGYEWEDVKDSCASIVTAYIEDLNKEWETSDNIIVRVSRIESKLLEINGIVDISKTLINGASSNLKLDRNSIAKFNSIEVA